MSKLNNIIEFKKNTKANSETSNQLNDEINENQEILNDKGETVSFDLSDKSNETPNKDVEEYDNESSDYDTKKNDFILEKDYLSSLIEQKDRLVYYEVENIYSNQNSKKFRNKMSLKKDPPILIVKDDYDNEANFILTQNLTEELINTLNEVNRAYYGFSEPRKLNQPSKFKDKVLLYFKSQPLKLLLPIIIVAFLLFFIFNQ